LSKAREIIDRFVLNMTNSAENLPQVTLVEIVDCRRVLVENHCGILAYGTCEIRIKARRGLISVSGKELKMAFMTVSQLIITGKIQTVNFLEEGI
jgi:sporulation protein YqfC